MIRKADPSDTMAIAAFLERHVETSMFLLNNLEAHGTDNTVHMYGTTFFLRETGDGITGVFGCTNGGFLMCQLPGLTATEAQTYAHLLQGYTLRGMTGDTAQASLILDALPVPQDAWQLRRVDPLYALHISELTVGDVQTRKAVQEDLGLLTDWFQAHVVETEMTSTTRAADLARQRAVRSIGSDRFRFMIEDGQPVAMAAINAKAGPAIQVGGVFVPAELRQKGRGGRVVAGLLTSPAADGASTAILFAASADAARVYERIGFERIGDYLVALLFQPLTLGPPS
jgi:N-acetylglutamate synthase-like GNAT family acetyltransferase